MAGWKAGGGAAKPMNRRAFSSVGVTIVLAKETRASSFSRGYTSIPPQYRLGCGWSR